MDKRYTSLKNKAKDRNLPLLISHNEYLSIVECNTCHYCGGTLPRVGYGLDRKNSKLGYIIDNVVPCCSIHNDEKGGLDYDEYQAIWDIRKKKTNNKLISFYDKFSNFSCQLTHECILIDGWLKIFIKETKERPSIATKSSLFFYEDEILEKFDIISSIIANKLNRTTKIFARKCEFKKPTTSELRSFLIKTI